MFLKQYRSEFRLDYNWIEKTDSSARSPGERKDHGDRALMKGKTGGISVTTGYLWLHTYISGLGESFVKW